jgi:hypothetical protein
VLQWLLQSVSHCNSYRPPALSACSIYPFGLPLMRNETQFPTHALTIACGCVPGRRSYRRLVTEGIRRQRSEADQTGRTNNPRSL